MREEGIYSFKVTNLMFFACLDGHSMNSLSKLTTTTPAKGQGMCPGSFNQLQTMLIPVTHRFPEAKAGSLQSRH